jgi:hypothetical protein
MPLRLLLAVALSGLPPAYFGLSSFRYDNGLKELAAQNKALMAIANEYLVKQCALNRIQRAPLQVEPSGGVFITADSAPLDLPDTPAPVPETPQMRNNQERYGESNPVDINHIQYKAPIYWVHQMYADSVLSASPFDFVEASDRDSRDYILRATARRQWWLGPGRQAIAPTSKELLEQRLSNLSDDKRNWLSLPVGSSTARYLFSVADISTLEDRRHWVARARFRLVHKASGETAAEYVGFAANLGPAYRPGTSYPWQRVAVCVGKEREYQVDPMSWKAADFFFREVVSYRPTFTQ